MIKAGLRSDTARRRGFPQRRGFTLVELLVVIAIIAVLAAILSVGVGAAIYFINQFTIRTEMKQLEMALTEYQREYGSYPPSMGTIPDTENATASAYYLTYFSRHFGTAFRNNRESLSMTTPLCDPAQVASIPVLAESTITNLDASETLPFFLGGAAQYWEHKGAGPVMGLKTDPVRPVTGSVNAAPVNLYEFDVSRLVDLDGDGFPSYLPKSGEGETPFLYFAAYTYKDPPLTAMAAEATGYAMWPPDWTTPGDPGDYGDWIDGTPAGTDYMGNGIADDIQGGYNPGFARPYLNGNKAGNPGTPPETFDWYAEDSYQILSAGMDGFYGPTGDPDFPNDIADRNVKAAYKRVADLSTGATPDRAWFNMTPQDRDNVGSFFEAGNFGDVALE